MDNSLSSRYVSGIIANKDTLDRSFIPGRLKFDDDRFNLISNSIVKLLNDGSSMSDSIILESIKSAFLALSDIEEWENGEREWFESFLYTSSELEIPKREIEELYTILQRQRLSDHTKRILTEIVIKNEINEEDIDTAQEKLRLIKAVYPSRIASLDNQSEKALIEAMNAGSGIIPYGFGPIDRSAGGACRKEITIIAGRPGHGKTSIVCQFVLNWIKNGYKVLFISKEMSVSRLLHKFFANIGNISSDQIKRGAVEDKDYLQSIAGGFVNKYKDKLFLYDDVYSSNEIEKLILKHKPDLIIDDFIQLGAFSKGSGDIRREITKTLERYKRLAKENNAAFIVLSQISRAFEGRDDPTPRISDLAESGSLEQLAGDIWFIYYSYKVNFDEATKNRVELIMAKSRYGESVRVPLGFNGNTMKYYAIPDFSKKES